MDKITVGYTSDWTGGATEKWRIVDETVSGKYVCTRPPEIFTNVYGEPYLSHGQSGLILRDKNDFVNVHIDKRIDDIKERWGL